VRKIAAVVNSLPREKWPGRGRITEMLAELGLDDRTVRQVTDRF
jgi:hypothetical protein